MKKCLAPKFLKRVRTSGELYRLLMFDFSGVLLEKNLEKGIRTIVRKTLFTIPKPLKRDYELRIHVEAMVLLMQQGWHDDGLNEWLRQTFEDKSLPFTHRRQAIRVLADHFGNLPDEAQLRLRSVLSTVASLPEWKIIPELMRFRRKEG
jgi:hypothetical protein